MVKLDRCVEALESGYQALSTIDVELTIILPDTVNVKATGESTYAVEDGGQTILI